MDIISVLGQLSATSPPLIAALLLGLMTSLSPCPFASNLAAIAFVAKKSATKRDSILSAFAYASGRSIMYLFLAILVGFVGLTLASLLVPLQMYSELLLSIILGFSGLVILGKIKIDLNIITPARLPHSRGVVPAFILGAGLALVFCPVSAALFIGGIIPLVISTKDWILLPVVYGVGTSLPVLLMSPLVRTVGKMGEKLGILSLIGDVSTKILGLIFLTGSAYYLISFMGL